MTTNPKARYAHHTDHPDYWRNTAHDFERKKNEHRKRIIELSNTTQEAHVGYVYGVRNFRILFDTYILSGVWGTWKSASITASCIERYNAPLATAAP